MIKNIKLRNGTEIEFNSENPKSLFDIIINDIFIPKYKETDDFNLAINIGLEEMNHIIKDYGLEPKL
ncbi:MAG TPA: hypothetical protein ENI51_08980, partial [Candidatus Atribacteria bacterium]|nr:hypothetical protein [Candidatus Atribacteria bacterium]